MSLLIKDLDLPLICWGCPCFDKGGACKRTVPDTFE